MAAVSPESKDRPSGPSRFAAGDGDPPPSPVPLRAGGFRTGSHAGPKQGIIPSHIRSQTGDFCQTGPCPCLDAAGKFSRKSVRINRPAASRSIRLIHARQISNTAAADLPLPWRSADGSGAGGGPDGCGSGASRPAWLNRDQSPTGADGRAVCMAKGEAFARSPRRVGPREMFFYVFYTPFGSVSPAIRTDSQLGIRRKAVYSYQPVFSESARGCWTHGKIARF
jgi:hypothetical protein